MAKMNAQTLSQNGKKPSDESLKIKTKPPKKAVTVKTEKTKGEIIMYVKIQRASAGLYHFKNGIKIVHEGNKWNVYYGSGEIAYTASTLDSCKRWIYRKYC